MTNQHLGDLLSALLDAELSPPEEAAARQHLDACHQCSVELDQVSAARAWVRALPQVEPPLGFIDRLIREEQTAGATPSWFRRGARPSWASRWTGVAALAGSAAAAVVVVGLVSPKEPTIQPPVGQMVEEHATAASLNGDPLTRLAPVGVPISFKR